MQTNKCNQPYQQSEGQNNMAISTDAEETQDKMVPPVLIRLYKLGVEGMSHMVKAIGGEFIASTLHSENLKASQQQDKNAQWELLFSVHSVHSPSQNS